MSSKRKGTRRDVLLYAVGVNDKHGVRRTNADKRRAVTLLLRDEEWGSKSDRWIAEQCAVGYTLVAPLGREALHRDDLCAGALAAPLLIAKQERDSAPLVGVTKGKTSLETVARAMRECAEELDLTWRLEDEEVSEGSDTSLPAPAITENVPPEPSTPAETENAVSETEILTAPTPKAGRAKADAKRWRKLPQARGHRRDEEGVSARAEALVLFSVGPSCGHDVRN